MHHTHGEESERALVSYDCASAFTVSLRPPVWMAWRKGVIEMRTNSKRGKRKQRHVSLHAEMAVQQFTKFRHTKCKGFIITTYIFLVRQNTPSPILEYFLLSTAQVDRHAGNIREVTRIILNLYWQPLQFLCIETLLSNISMQKRNEHGKEKS